MRRLGGVAVAMMLASCTFPDVTFGDASAPIDATTEAASDGGDGGTDDGGDAAPDPCDRDHDGYKSPSCGGNDCNDDDPRVNPGVTSFVYDVPDAAPFGDWNCDGQVVKTYPNVISLCTTSCGAQGFEAVVDCGMSATLVQCVGSITCTKADAGLHTQGCL